MNDPQRPVLFLFAGKAHPADEPGQQVLREIKQLMLTPEFIGRVVFLEDYDLQLARWLVSGVDVWLNNPIAPLEASGTSGMKAAVNGRLNLSVLDGWWAEAWTQDNGWGIPPINVQDPERRDALEAELIFDTLEEETCLSITVAQRRRSYLAGVGPAQQARDGDRHPALQHAPHGVRLRAGRVLTRPRGSTVKLASPRLRGRAPARRLEAARAPGVAEGAPAHPDGAARRICRAASGCACEWRWS